MRPLLPRANSGPHSQGNQVRQPRDHRMGSIIAYLIAGSDLEDRRVIPWAASITCRTVRSTSPTSLAFRSCTISTRRKACDDRGLIAGVGPSSLVRSGTTCPWSRLRAPCTRLTIHKSPRPHRRAQTFDIGIDLTETRMTFTFHLRSNNITLRNSIGLGM